MGDLVSATSLYDVQRPNYMKTLRHRSVSISLFRLADVSCAGLGPASGVRDARIDPARGHKGALPWPITQSDRYSGHRATDQLPNAESGVEAGPRGLGSGPAPNAPFWRCEVLAIGAHRAGGWRARSAAGSSGWGSGVMAWLLAGLPPGWPSRRVIPY